MSDKDTTTISKRGDSGVLLLIVMVALILLATSLIQIATTTSRMQRMALAAEFQLQQRWGCLSCETAILPVAELIFDQSDASSNRSFGTRQARPHQITGQIQLENHSFALILADESAKADLNRIYDLDGQSEVRQTLSDVAGLNLLAPVDLRPSRGSLNDETAADARRRGSRFGLDDPSDADPSGSDNPSEAESVRSAIARAPAFASWGDVIDLAQLQNQGSRVRMLAQWTQHVTLFGGAKLNVWRASDETIVATARSVVQSGLARRIVDRMGTSTLSDIELILQQTVTNASNRNQLIERLGNQSDSFSLWSESSGPVGRAQRWTVRSLNTSTGEATWRTFEFD
ncbi:MAG: hypothetical protein AAF539_03505 [Planctomycetota bacterium]